MRFGRINPAWRLGIAVTAALWLASPAAAEDNKSDVGPLHMQDVPAPVPAPDSLAPPVSPDATSPPLPAPAAGLSTSVNIPELNATGSNVDEATLKEIFSGHVAENAAAIAGLTADSIVIPEMDVTMTGAPGNPFNVNVSLHDIDVETVTDGVAKSVSIGGIESRSASGGSVRLGKMSAEAVDIGGYLGFYGLVKGDPTAPLKPLYANLAQAGGTITTPKGNCTIGKLSVAGVKVRPLKTSVGDFIALASQVGPAAGTPPPEVLGRLIEFYADMLSAIETSPLKFDGFNCSLVNEQGAPVEFSVGGVTVGNFGGLRYPGFIVRNLRVAAGASGTFSLGQFELKGFDLTSFFAAASALVARSDPSPTAEDYRALVPPFAGFSMSDLKVDVPDEQDPGQRIKATLGDFDLDLGNYVNGVATIISSRASHLAAILPPGSSDASVQSLLAVGLHSVDLSYDIGVRWDQANREIRVSRFSLNGDHLGAIEATGVIGQATEDLFASDPAQALAAALGLTVKQVNIHVRDDGLGDLLAAASATGAGKQAVEVRRTASATVQAALLFMLGGAANATEISGALGDFINGAKSLWVSVISNDPAGISVNELQGAEDNPGQIANDVTIDAEAR